MTRSRGSWDRLPDVPGPALSLSVGSAAVGSSSKTCMDDGEGPFDLRSLGAAEPRPKNPCNRLHVHMASDSPAVARNAGPWIPRRMWSSDRTAANCELEPNQRIRDTPSIRLRYLHRQLAIGRSSTAPASDTGGPLTIEKSRRPGPLRAVRVRSGRGQLPRARASDQVRGV